MTNDDTLRSTPSEQPDSGPGPATPPPLSASPSQSYCDIVPLPSEEQFAALKEDIRRRGGVVVPIELDESGNLLDGRSRMRAHAELTAEGVKLRPIPWIIQREMSEEEKRALVRSLNIHRRHLTPEQLRTLIEDQIRETPDRSDRQIAKTLCVSNSTVGSVRQEMEEAGQVPESHASIGSDGKAYPRHKHKVIQGTTEAAMRKARTVLHEIARLRAEGLSDDAEALDRTLHRNVNRAYANLHAKMSPPSAPPAAPENLPATFHVADALHLSQLLPRESVDLIVTSPPYGLGKPYGNQPDTPQDWRGWMTAWLWEAHMISKPDGRLALNVPLDTTLGGHRPTFVDAVIAAQLAHWHYRFSIVWHEPSVSRSLARGSIDSPEMINVIAPVEMIAVFGRSPEWRHGRDVPSDLPHDAWLQWTNGLWKFDGERGSRLGHPAPFPEELPRRLILMLSDQCDTVLDPFCGSGTTIVVGTRLGRKAIGVDINEEYVRQAKERLVASLDRDGAQGDPGTDESGEASR